MTEAIYEDNNVKIIKYGAGIGLTGYEIICKKSELRETTTKSTSVDVIVAGYGGE